MELYKKGIYVDKFKMIWLCLADRISQQVRIGLNMIRLNKVTYFRIYVILSPLYSICG